MKNLLNNFFKKKFTPEFIVFFRISIGIIILFHFLSYSKDFNLLYTQNSIIPLELHTIYNNYNIFKIENILLFLNNYLDEYYSILSFKLVYISLCLMIISGFFSRFSAIILIILQISFIKSGSLFFYGADFFTSMSLFYIVIFPSSSFYSLNKKLFRKLSRNKQSLTLCKRLIQIHICIAYFFSGFDKILGFNWWNGESVWKAVHLPNLYSYIEIGNHIQNPIFYIILGWGVIIIELFYPIFINLANTRKIWLTLTISMHLGIILSFNLFFFSSIMIVWNLTSYYFNYYHENKTIATNTKHSTDTIF